MTRSTWPVAGGLGLIAMIVLRTPASPPVLDPPLVDVPSVEDTSLSDSLTVRDPEPPPFKRCVLAGRPRSAARTRAAIEWFRDLSARDRELTSAICSEDISKPCRALMPAPSNTPKDPEFAKYLRDQEREGRRRVDRMIARVSEIDRGCITDYCDAVQPMYCDTPLVLAFESQPIEFAPAGSARFAFSGAPVATAWPTAATPWVAIDLDHDGAITSGAELFGDATRLPDGATAENGFAALAALDANHDGTIDPADPAFASLLIWTDRNGDHASSPDELSPLSDAVTAIQLANRLEPRCDRDGNCEGERGTFRWRDAGGVPHAGAVVDVYLRHH